MSSGTDFGTDRKLTLSAFDLWKSAPEDITMWSYERKQLGFGLGANPQNNQNIIVFIGRGPRKHPLKPALYDV